jgi:outer membrane receptor protein involved in Fe transport
MFHDRTFRRICLVLLLAGVFATAASAGTVGKISGVVKNAATGEPLANAAVVIVTTTMGASTGADGSFFILNVPAGTYDVQAQVIGYKPLMVQNVLVAPDFTTELNFSLEQTVAATLEAVKVEAQRPVFQRDATSTVRILDSKQYNSLPTRGYQDAASIQAGVVSSQGNSNINVQGNETTNSPVLFIRGGRANEVAYFVDGFSQQDPLTGYSTTSINTNAVDQVVVMTGGFAAEYGRIMSGAVNVVTKEGGAKYFGTAEAVTDNLSGNWIGTKKYDYNIYGASLGGPLLPNNDKVTFFASGERRWERDRSPRSLAGGPLPFNQLSGWTWQGKIAWKLTPGISIKAGTLGSRDDWQEYRHAYRLTGPHTPRYQDRNASYFGTFTDKLNPDTYFNISGNYFMTERESGDGVYFNKLNQYARLATRHTGHDSTYVVDVGNRTWDQYALFWSAAHDSTPSHVWDDYQHRKSSYLGFTGDLTHKWTDHNTAKFGVDLQRHTLRFYQALFPATYYLGLAGGGYDDVVNYGYDRTGTKELNGKEGRFQDGAKHPISASLYLQNKYEYSDFVVNAGLRYDYLDPKTQMLVNPNLPLENGNTSNLDPSDLKASKAKNKVSPRLGIGFPVSEQTLFHANYGKFFQQPNLQDLYTSYRYLEYKVRIGGYYFPFGNPNLEPETTTAYEIGLTHAPSSKVRVDATAYYKDVENLVQVQNQPSSPANFASYRNSDFGTIKGIDLNLQVMETLGFSGSLSYSLSYATGTGSISDSQRNIAWTVSQAPKQTAPLSFDQRHKVALNIDYRTREGVGPRVAGFRPLQKLDLNLLFNAASGFPYTPIVTQNEVTLAAVSTTPTGPINSRYGPWTNRVDGKVTRSFNVGGVGLDAFVWVLNLFDTVSELNVYQSSGTAYTTGWLSTEEGRKWAQDFGAAGVATFKAKETNPNNFGIPRMVRFGLKTSF